MIKLMPAGLNKIINSETELNVLAEAILEYTFPHKVFAFYGNIGAGKTTLIKEICRHLGVSENLSSPSFSIINEYHSNENKTIYHMDLYRLKNNQELLEIGIEEYLSAENYCLVEWPELALKYFPKEFIEVKISIFDDNKRKLEISIVSG